MTLVYRLKPAKDRTLRPAARVLSSAGVTPNMVTIAGLAVSAMAGAVAASGHLRAGIVLFIAGACCDAVDGSLARVAGRSSEFGRYLDSVCDRLAEGAFITGAVLGGVSLTAMAVIAGSVLLLASRIRNHRRGLDSDAALIARPERLVLLVAGMLSPFPADVALFLSNALLCAISAGLVLASGTDPSAVADTNRKG